MNEIDTTTNTDDFERNEVTLRMEPPPQWFIDSYWLKAATQMARMVPVSVEADEDTTPLIDEIHARLFPRHPFGNQG